ncbi:hypothetical protein LEP1GSC163_0020 [Leptospira santarosai str. CBC379]|uniref:Uncharacterized protein n=1 Tax=Leptospira santarosai str. MOR084 TaxID=1049984 RepID=A0A0E2BCI5_9LEPT|nr:hypothetical protein LEP1GSC179_3837 [Leptospira santarosai str. MOR084]EKR89645.1 hypothetical protein LEP1GSC163_0020 [Leptospira santarosai str. CBC379]
MAKVPQLFVLALIWILRQWIKQSYLYEGDQRIGRYSSFLYTSQNVNLILAFRNQSTLENFAMGFNYSSLKKVRISHKKGTKLKLKRKTKRRDTI